MMIKSDWITHFGSARITGVITSAMVAMIGLYLTTQLDSFRLSSFICASLLYAGNIVLFVHTTKERWNDGDGYLKSLVLLQLVTVVALFFTLPFTFNAILLSIWSGHLVYFFRLSISLLFIAVLATVFYGVFHFYWGYENVFLTAILYSSLTMFTVVMVDALRKESIAKDESQQLYRELLAAQSLLREATKQSERVRIARNIHDLVGHHLTALTINLQVALHKTDGEAKQQIEKSFAIAKLLLSDVREAVTEIREKSNIELKSSLQALVEKVPRLNIELQLADDLAINDVEIADTIVKCVQESITNTLKHSHGDVFKVRLFSDEGNLVLEMQDNGNSQQDFTLGNGLKGIQERIAKLAGKVGFDANEQGFVTRIELPLGQG